MLTWKGRSGASVDHQPDLKCGAALGHSNSVPDAERKQFHVQAEPVQLAF